MTPDELAAQFLRIDEIGTPERPRARIVMAHYGMLAQVLGLLAEKAREECPPKPKAKDVYDRLMEDDT